jgi:hypothetical protein
MNNLKEFRELAQIPPETFSKLLLIQKRRYLMMERGTIETPEWVLVMISKLYGIDKSVMLDSLEDISGSDINLIKSIADIAPETKEIFLANRLTGKSRKRVYAADMQKVKNRIIDELQEK